MVKKKITPSKRKKESYKMGGHFVDMTLKSSFDNKEKNIFDTLTKPVQELVAQYVTAEFINYKGEGIKLTGAEYRLIDALNILLHQKSNNNNEPEEPNYYFPSFDGFQPIFFFNGKKYIQQQMLYLSLYELTQHYKGNKKVSGKDCDNLLKILTDLSFNPEKKALIKYVRETKTKKDKITEKIEEFQSLIKIQHIEKEKESLTTGEKKIFSEYIIHINPIFRDQLETKFIPVPCDITQKMTEAYGKVEIPAFIYKLRNYLIREFSSKRYQSEISVERLLWIIEEDNMKSRQKKRAFNNLCTAIEVMNKISLLLNHNIETNSKGEPKLIFNLNQSWFDNENM